MSHFFNSHLKGCVTFVTLCDWCKMGMMLPFWEVPSELDNTQIRNNFWFGRNMLRNVNRHNAGVASPLGAIGRDFGWGKNILRVWYNCNKISRSFSSHQGAGLDGWRQSILDDVPFWEMPSKLMMLALGCCWAQWAWFFIEKKGYITSYSMYVTIHLVGGRQEWVDGSGQCWMWLPFLELPNPAGYG